MIFDTFSDEEFKSHAMMAPSSANVWLGAPPEWYDNRIISYHAADIGTSLHEFAAENISMQMKLNKSDGKLVLRHLLKAGFPREVINVPIILPMLSMYINDAIGYGMKAEVRLKYSDNCYGTADTMLFDERTSTLRIHDYKSYDKSSKTKPHPEQLLSYAGLFLLQYGKRYGFTPEDLKYELYFYQTGQEGPIPVPTNGADISNVCTNIVNGSQYLDKRRMRGLF